MSWRDVVHLHRSGPESLGAGQGFVVRLDLPGATDTHITLDEAVLLRQVQRVLLRVVDENRTVIRETAGSESPLDWLALAWEVAKRIRVPGRWRYPGGLSGYVTDWEVGVMERYDAFLARLFAEQREAVELALRVDDLERVAIS